MGTTIGDLHVRRSSFIRASAERVWQEFESFERVKPWLGLGHRLDRFESRPEGMVEFSVEIDGERAGFGGRIVVFEPQREVTIENQWDRPRAWVVPTFLTIRLAPLYDGTLVELFHHGFERLGNQAAGDLEGYEAGWDNKHLKALRAIVEADQ